MDFMRSKLEEYDDFKDGLPEFETIIRYLGGHKTDTHHPAMASIRKSYETLGIKYEQSGLGIASDAFAFMEASKTDVVILGPRGGNAHGIDRIDGLVSTQHDSLFYPTVLRSVQDVFRADDVCFHGLHWMELA